ncbi:DUF2087 domain-containing protein [Metabacillus malikii]|uniref:DUF2087 domain-containing protein n=1 Tax=Metabacillus malikii TaxID=1504265 RepID=A0ABT9ZAX2_9BACI|nr:DUF2087 domain-containing protein [Metabacillus malikii]MDQ0229367.1 hypothetical protein [Metabacillus malikii]
MLGQSDNIWDADINDLKQGYKENANAYTCLLCGQRLEKGLVFHHEDVFYEAERFMKVHIETTHQSVFDYLIDMDKKVTGLTDHQNKLLRLFYQGKNDTEIQKELEVGSTSTIRHHRFALKEKERQAKTFLVLMELLKEKDEHAPAFVPPHHTATMLDDRYNVTFEEQNSIIAKYFSTNKEKLTKFPTREKQKIVILREIANRLEDNKTYTEKELNERLKRLYDDYVLIRRYLIEYGFVDRKQDGSQYWLRK